MKTTILRAGEVYFGVDITADGRLVVAERMNGRPVRAVRLPGGQDGANELRRLVEREEVHAHVCIKACGAAALALATALIPVPGIAVTIVKPQPGGTASAPAPEDGAARLARLAERLF